MSAARKAFADRRRELDDVRRMNLRLSEIIDANQIYMYTRSQGVIKVAETLIGQADPSLGHLLEELGGEPHAQFEARPCKLRVLSQRKAKIWQIVDPEKRALCQCNHNSKAPQLVAEALLWLACAGFNKASLQQAKDIMQAW
jgi:hypothetical protein